MHFIGQFVHLIWEKLSLWRIYNIISISEEAIKKLETKRILIFIGITFVALFFVDGQYHRKGIGKKLWEAVLSNTSANLITVHSSLYAAEIYKKLGFYQTQNESFRPWLWQLVFDIPIAQRSEKAYVVGLYIVTDTLERNAVKAFVLLGK